MYPEHQFYGLYGKLKPKLNIKILSLRMFRRSDQAGRAVSPHCASGRNRTADYARLRRNANRRQHYFQEAQRGGEGKLLTNCVNLNLTFCRINEVTAGMRSKSGLLFFHSGSARIPIKSSTRQPAGLVLCMLCSYIGSRAAIIQTGFLPAARIML